MGRSDMTCSFCGGPQSEVRLIASPESITICEECVLLCNDVLSNQPGVHVGGGWTMRRSE